MSNKYLTIVSGLVRLKQAIATSLGVADASKIVATNASGYVDVAVGGTGAGTQAGARSNLGLGTIATQDANNVAVTGGTIVGVTTLSASNAAGTATTLLLNSSGSPRWGLAKNSSSESGSNAGSDFDINRYDDAGVLLGSAFQITRGSGNIRFGSNLLIVAASGAIQSNGTGSGSVSGDARGTGAVDLQNSRGSSTQVASGTRSFVVGTSNTASGQQAIAMGFTNTASANHAVALGRSNTASAQAAFAVGDTNIAEAVNSAAFGRSATAKRQNELVVGAGGFTTNADAQFSWMPLKISQTGTTLVEMLSNTVAGGGTCTLQDDSALAFDITIVARAISSEEAAAFQFTGLIRRGAGAATVTLVGTPTKTVIARDVASWDATVDADTTTGSLRVRVQGEAAKSIRWVGRVNLVEVVA